MAELRLDITGMIVFEIIKIRTNDPKEFFEGKENFEKISAVFYHPLLVGPTSIKYSDRSKTSIKPEQGDDARATKGGRQPLKIELAGTFGKKPYFFGAGAVDGMTRLHQFWNEAIRLGDAITKKDVEAVKDVFSSNQLARQAAGAVFDAENPFEDFIEGQDVFAVNLYDFIHGRKMCVNIDVFEFTHAAPRNLPMYQMSMTRLRDTVTPTGRLTFDNLFDATGWVTKTVGFIEQFDPHGFADIFEDAKSALNGLDNLEIIQFFQGFDGGYNVTIPSALQGTNPPNTTSNNSGSGAGNNNKPGSAQVPQSPSSLIPNNSKPQNPADSTNPMPGGGTGSGSYYARSSSTFILECDRAVGQLGAVLESMATFQDDTPYAAEYFFNPATKFNDYGKMMYIIETVKSAMTYLRNGHVFFQLSEEEFQARLDSIASGNVTPPTITRTIPYVFKDTDYLVAIAEKFNLAVSDILAYNLGISFDYIEPGTIINIPVRTGLPKGNASLPVFGSISEMNALGRDVTIDMEIDEDGDFEVLEPSETFAQGINVITKLFSLIWEGSKAIEMIPDPATLYEYLKIQYVALVLKDARVKRVNNATVSQKGESGLLIKTDSIEAITAGQVNLNRV